MSDIKKCTTLDDLKAKVSSFGPRKEFKQGDEIVCVQRPYGQKSPLPGDRVIVVEPCTVYPMNDGTPMAAGEVADHLGCVLEDSSPDGFLARPLNSRFFVLASEYVEPTPAQEG